MQIVQVGWLGGWAGKGTCTEYKVESCRGKKVDVVKKKGWMHRQQGW